MMDSQENTLELGKVEEAQQTPEVAAEVNNDESKPAKAEKESLKTYKTKKEVIDRLKDIVSSDEAPSKEEIDYLKTSFYKIHIAERDAQQKAYIEDGGNVTIEKLESNTAYYLKDCNSLDVMDYDYDIADTQNTANLPETHLFVYVNSGFDVTVPAGSVLRSGDSLHLESGEIYLITVKYNFWKVELYQ